MTTYWNGTDQPERLEDHVVRLERPRLGSTKPHYQYVCRCGWRSMPRYSDRQARRSVMSHLTHVQDTALKDALLDAGEAGERLSVAAWKEQHALIIREEPS